MGTQHKINGMAQDWKTAEDPTDLHKLTCIYKYITYWFCLRLMGNHVATSAPFHKTFVDDTIIVLPQRSITTNTALASVLRERKDGMPPLSVTTMRLPNSESCYVMVGLLWSIGAMENNSSIVREAKRGRLDYWVRLSFATSSRGAPG